MIARLRGDVVEIALDHLVLDVNGVGYEVFVTTRTAETARLDAPLTLHVHTALREDALTLYGFASAADKVAFLQLNTVQGVGARTALNALSTLAVDALATAVNGNDLKALCSIPGVGKKTAERMVLELKGKLSSAPSAIPTSAPRAAPDDQLPLALAQLGYKKSEIDQALARLSERGLTAAPLNDRLAESLRLFAAGGRA
ncbi:MAG: Holliday junction branch migration protein RuvA [Pseudomonadota bacterium]|nr:Holliday junction branch migration protein RuvA [Pseudomonadota bacterium]